MRAIYSLKNFDESDADRGKTLLANCPELQEYVLHPEIKKQKCKK